AEGGVDVVVDEGFRHRRAQADVEAAAARPRPRIRGRAAAVVACRSADRDQAGRERTAARRRVDLLIDFGEADRRAEPAAEADAERADDVKHADLRVGIDGDRPRRDAGADDLRGNAVSAGAGRLPGHIRAGCGAGIVERAAAGIQHAHLVAVRGRADQYDADGAGKARRSAEAGRDGDRADVADAVRFHQDVACRGDRAARNQRRGAALEDDEVDRRADTGAAADGQAADGRVDGVGLLRLNRYVAVQGVAGIVGQARVIEPGVDT